MIIRDRKGTPILDLPFNVCNGELVGIEPYYKFGRIEGLAAVTKTVWTGSSEMAYPTAPLTTYFASTSSLDVCTGTIIKAVEFEYLNSSWDKVTEIHSCNGLTPVALSQPYLRINRAKFLSNCETHINTGNIWLGSSAFTVGVPAIRYGHIPSGMQQTHQAFYSVARGDKVKIYDINITVNEGKESSIWMEALDHGEVYSGWTGLSNTNQHKNHYDIFQSVFSSQRKVPLTFEQMTDITFNANGSAGGSVNLSVEWTMIVISSDYFVNDNR